MYVCMYICAFVCTRAHVCIYVVYVQRVQYTLKELIVSSMRIFPFSSLNTFLVLLTSLTRHAGSRRRKRLDTVIYVSTLRSDGQSPVSQSAFSILSQSTDLGKRVSRRTYAR